MQRSSSWGLAALLVFAVGCTGGEEFPQYTANYQLVADQTTFTSNMQDSRGPSPFVNDVEKIPRTLRIAHRKSLSMGIMQDYLRMEFNPEKQDGQPSETFDVPLQALLASATPGRRDSFPGLEFYRAKDPTLSTACLPFYVFTLGLDGEKTIPSPNTLARAYPLKKEVITDQKGNQIQLSEPPLAKLEMDQDAVTDWRKEMDANGGQYVITILMRKHLYNEFPENCEGPDQKYVQPGETLVLTYRSVDADDALMGSDIRKQSANDFDAYDPYSVRRLFGAFVNWNLSILL